MRKLKFRAWDKFHKTMDEVDGYYLYIADGELYEIFEETQGYETYMQKHIVTDKHEVMQCTGLRDSNGTEIYEGDIFVNRGLRTAVVEWEREGRFLGLTIGGERRLMYINREPKVEVIGNIYSNPELIKGVVDDDSKDIDPDDCNVFGNVARTSTGEDSAGAGPCSGD